MTRVADRETARKLRAEGKSYSEIKQTLSISKSTLSGWLQDMPLSKEQIRQLRDLNPKRIESFRTTMEQKRQKRLQEVSERVKKEIGAISERELFIGGLYLYWGEGLKASRGTIGIANTDPAVIKTFIEWLRLLKIPKEKMSVKLHLYTDMDIDSETKYWSSLLSIPKNKFRKPYVKVSRLSGLTYKNGHGHGTCNVLVESMPMWEYITMAIQHLRELPFRP